MNKRPFLGTEALAAGIVTRRTLASRHDAIYRNVYVPKGCRAHRDDARDGGVVVVGPPSDGCGIVGRCSARVEMDRPAPSRRGVSPQREASGRHPDPSRGPADDEVGVCVAGSPTTTPARTAFDLGRRRGRIAGGDRLSTRWRTRPVSSRTTSMPLSVDTAVSAGLCNYARQSTSWTVAQSRLRRRVRDLVLLIAADSAAADSDPGLRRVRVLHRPHRHGL